MGDEDKREEIGAVERRLPCCRHVPNYPQAVTPNYSRGLWNLVRSWRWRILSGPVDVRGLGVHFEQAQPANHPPAPQSSIGSSSKRHASRHVPSEPPSEPFPDYHFVALRERLVHRTSDLGFFEGFAELISPITLHSKSVSWLVQHLVPRTPSCLFFSTPWTQGPLAMTHSSLSLALLYFLLGAIYQQLRPAPLGTMTAPCTPCYSHRANKSRVVRSLCHQERVRRREV